MREGETMQENPCFSYRYQLTRDEYFAYNQAIAALTYGKARKKALLVGSGEMILAIAIFLLTILAPAQNQTLVLILSVLLFVMGGYSVGFYLILFPRALRKQSDHTFSESEYLQQEITLSFYDSVLIDAGADDTRTYGWDEVSSIRETDQLYLIIAADRRGLILPKRVVTDPAFAAFLTRQQETYEIKGSVL